MSIIKQGGSNAFLSFTKGSISAFSIRLAGIMAQFIFNVILGRSLGVSGTGLFFLVMSIVNIIGVVSRVGLDNTLIRIIPTKMGNPSDKSMLGIYLSSLSLVLILSIALSAVIRIYGVDISKIFDDSEFLLYINAICLLIFPYSAIWYYSYFLQGAGRIALSQILQSVYFSFSGITILVILNYLDGMSLENVLAGYILCASILVLILELYVRRIIGSKHNANSFSYMSSLGEIKDIAFPMFITSVMNVVILWTPTIILGVLSTSYQLGGYQIASRNSQLILFFMIAVNAIAAPRFSSLSESNDYLILEKTIKYTSILSFYPSLPVALFLILFPTVILKFYGIEFVNFSLELIILSIGMLVYVFMGSVSYVLMMTGYQNIYKNIIILSFLFNCITCIVLVPRYGALGASIATASSYVINHGLSAYYVWKIYRISPLPFFKNRISDE